MSMNKYLVLFGLILMASVIHAEEKKKIYKYTDENGVTHYTETKPNENYEEADLPALSIVPSVDVTKTPTNTVEETSDDAAEKFQFKIIAPVEDENIWGTGLKLTAKATPLSDTLQNVYQIQFVIDGKKQPPSNNHIQEFENIFRGQHKIQALMIKRETGETVRKSKTVTFFMHQNTKK